MGVTRKSRKQLRSCMKETTLGFPEKIAHLGAAGYLVSSSHAAPSLPRRAQARGKVSSPFEVELWAQRDWENWTSDQGWDLSAPRSIWLQT